MTSTATTMTYEQATEQAVRLHNQGMTYPKIEEHFKALGYTSPRTKKPVGFLAIRHMVTSQLARDEADIKEDQKEEAASTSIQLVSPTRDLLDAVGKVLDIDGISAAIKIRLVKNLLSNEIPTHTVKRVRGKNVSSSVK